MCCRSKDELQDLIGEKGCITKTEIFMGLLSQGLEYSRFIHASAIRNSQKRQQYLSKEMTNGLRRHLLYRNFVLMLNSGRPLGKNNRIVLPKCVIEEIPTTYRPILSPTNKITPVLLILSVIRKARDRHRCY